MAKHRKGGETGQFLAHLEDRVTPEGGPSSPVTSIVGGAAAAIGRGQVRQTPKRRSLAVRDGDEPDEEN